MYQLNLSGNMSEPSNWTNWSPIINAGGAAKYKAGKIQMLERYTITGKFLIEGEEDTYTYVRFYIIPAKLGMSLSLIGGVLGADNGFDSYV